MVFFRKFHDKFMGICNLCGLRHLFRVGVGISIGDIINNTVIKENPLLSYNAKKPSKIAEIVIPEIFSIQRDLTNIRVIKPWKEVGQG